MWDSDKDILQQRNSDCLEKVPIKAHVRCDSSSFPYKWTQWTASNGDSYLTVSDFPNWGAWHAVYFWYVDFINYGIYMGNDAGIWMQLIEMSLNGIDLTTVCDM